MEKKGLKRVAIPAFVALALVLFGAVSLYVAAKGGLKGLAPTTPAARVTAAKGGEVAPPPPAKKPEAKETILYSFDRDAEGWCVPDWTSDKPDYVAKSSEVTADFKSQGKSSLKLTADFPGKVWTAAIVEVEEYLNLSAYDKIACDVYLPEGAPEGLKAKLILTVGEEWRFTEMSRSIFLLPGKWITVSASLKPNSDDWKRGAIDDRFRADVRKIAIRIESNRGPVYSGPVYIDNIRVSSGS
jgi:hypothetical protein